MGDNVAAQNIVASARADAGGFEMGGDRAIPNPPNWNSQQSQELYHGAVTDNDPGTAEATGQQWTKHGVELKQASDNLYNAIAELGNAWVGHGAAGAQGALVSIANSGSQASDAAHTMADRLSKQAAAAAEVKKMPAPRDFDPKQAMAAALAGGPAAMAADQKAQSDAANDVKAQQVAFFNAYTQSMSEVDGSTPSFGPDSLGMKPTASHFNGNSFHSLNGGSHPGGSLPGVGGVGTPGAGAPMAFGHGGHSGAPVSGGAHVTADSGTYGTSGAAPTALPAAAGPGLGAPGAAGAGTGAVSGAAAPITTSAPAGGSGSSVGAALGLGVVGGGAGFAGAKLGQGTRSGARKDEESTSSAAAEHQNGQSAASVAPQQGVVPAGGTIGGQAGAAPMGGMGGGMGGQRPEDEEHTHASFLIEPDPDDAFGANQATPPPVIGAWSDEDDD
ncbi:hypothetical protein NYF13_08555 [Amycolatopsis sp. PS_44_ISF1]|nr:hypothetical protein [Amycolatopsis sp. PS_44_ISF1]MDT8910955.1 hypothetical protein [Amycolatopsis sp. PS_44_ISF1]